MFNRWLNLSVFPEAVQSIASIFVRISALRGFSENLLIITLILFFLDTLDEISVGIIWSIYFLVLAIVDYPTGILGDQIGYRMLLTLAYILKISAILVLLYGNSLMFYTTFMVLYALGNSQESGALESWFDNHYKDKMQDIDDTRDLYTSFVSRKSGLLYAMAVLGFLSGGFIAGRTSEKFLFFIYLILNIFILMLVLQMPVTPLLNRVSVRGYFETMHHSLKVFFGNRVIFFYLMGTAIMWSANESIWFTFQIYRLYREYTGSDEGTGILRSLVLLSGMLWSLLVIPLVKYFKNARFWVFVSSFVSNAIFFVLIIFYYSSFPPSGFNLILVIGFLMIYQLPASWEALEGTLRQKITIDLIPSEVRNSLYSMLPTLSRLLGGFFVLFTGLIIHRWGFIASMWWLVGICALGSTLLGIGLIVTAPEPKKA